MAKSWLKKIKLKLRLCNNIKFYLNVLNYFSKFHNNNMTYL